MDGSPQARRQCHFPGNGRRTQAGLQECQGCQLKTDMQLRHHGGHPRTRGVPRAPCNRDTPRARLPLLCARRSPWPTQSIVPRYLRCHERQGGILKPKPARRLHTQIGADRRPPNRRRASPRPHRDRVHAAAEMQFAPEVPMQGWRPAGMQIQGKPELSSVFGERLRPWGYSVTLPQAPSIYGHANTNRYVSPGQRASGNAFTGQHGSNRRSKSVVSRWLGKRTRG